MSGSSHQGFAGFQIIALHCSLFVHEQPRYLIVIDTTIRDALKKVLSHVGLPSEGFGFHVFRRSGDTVAFDHQVPLEHIMAHGIWQSNAV